jgi:hypothetical protein
MAVIEFVKASGRSSCRGGLPNCLCPKKGRLIPKGFLSLRIEIYGAGGGATAFYCSSCMVPLIENCRDVVDEWDK